MTSTSRVSMLARAAAAAPNAPAMIDGDDIWSYSELLREVRAIAESWPEGSEIVAVPAHADRSHLLGLLAVFESGRPLLPLHPAWSDAQTAAACERLGVALLHLDPHERTLDERGTKAPISSCDAGSPMAVLLTSGSRAEPKAVCLSRRNFEASAEAASRRFPWRSQERWLLSLPHAHVGGLSIITRCLLAAKPFVLPPNRRADVLLEAMHRHRITRISLVPAMLKEIIDLAGNDGPPPSLRLVLVGGAAIGEEVLQRALDRKWPVTLSYGATETCSLLLASADRELVPKHSTAGEALYGTEVRIVDGLIQCRGPMLFEGYLEAGRLRSDRDEHGWYATGDLGRFDAVGRVHVEGRADEMIVTGGENVSPLRVEQSLRRCPGIRDVMVFSLPDSQWGEVVAALICARDPNADLADLASEIRHADLASFERPRLVRLIGSIPTNTLGKPDRKAARALGRQDLTLLKSTFPDRAR